jgi:hypothetical protein
MSFLNQMQRNIHTDATHAQRNQPTTSCARSQLPREARISTAAAAFPRVASSSASSAVTRAAVWDASTSRASSGLPAARARARSKRRPEMAASTAPVWF